MLAEAGNVHPANGGILVIPMTFRAKCDAEVKTMKKIVSVVLAFAMCLSLLSVTALAVNVTPQYINVTAADVGGNPTGAVFGDLGESTAGVYLTESGTLNTDCSDFAAVINNAAVTLGENGAVNTEELYIFGNGSLTVGSVTFTAGHGNTIGGSGAEDVLSAVMTEGSDALNVSGSLGAGETEEELTVCQAIVNETLTLGGKGHLTVTGSLTVSGTLTAAQDASLTVGSDAAVSGIALYNENGLDAWTEFANEETFVWLETDDGGAPIQKWVRFVDDGGTDYDTFGSTAELPYLVEFHWNDGGSVTVDGAYDQIFDGNNTKVRVADTVESLTFALHPDENYAVDAVRVEQEGTVGNEHGFVALDTDLRYDAEEMTFTIDLTGDRYSDDQGTKFVNINFDFRSESGEAPERPEDGTVRVSYNGCMEGDEQTAFVSVSGCGIAANTAVAPDAAVEFTYDQQGQEGVNDLTFTLRPVPPEDPDDYVFIDSPIVEINIFDGDETRADKRYLSWLGGDMVFEPTRRDYALKVTHLIEEEAFSGKFTFTITLDSDSAVSVSVFWTQREKYDALQPQDGEIAAVHRTLGLIGVQYTLPQDVEERGSDSCFGDDEFTYYKDIYTDNCTSLTLFISDEGGIDPEQFALWLGDRQVTAAEYTLYETGGPVSYMEYPYAVYEWDVSQELTIIGKQSEGPEQPDPQDAAEGAAEYIRNTLLAYYATDPDTAKAYMAKQLWTEGTNVDGRGINVYDGVFETMESLADAITLSEKKDGGVAPLEYYYDYTVDLGNSVTASGRVYWLASATRFVVNIGNNEFQVVDAADRNGDDTVYLRSVGNDLSGLTVFGNGVCAVGALEFGSGNGLAFHITQEHSGLAGVVSGNPSCRLAVVSDDYQGTKIIGETEAAAWGFIKEPTYAVDTGEPAELYYGNDGTVGRSVKFYKNSELPGGKDLVSLAVDTDKTPGAVATIADAGEYFSVNFNSNYDVIHMILRYEGDTADHYMEIHRVGLNIAENHVMGNGKYNVWHSTDNAPEYEAPVGAQQVITAAFYYKTGSILPEEHVKLFVTVKYNDGTKKMSVVNSLGGFVETTGGDKYADDFLLWSGTEAQYNNVKSVSAIVYHEGDGTTFGGVQVGSGTGVTWVRPVSDQ